MSVTVDSLALGPVSANTYIVTDDATGETAVIDAGACTEELLDKLNGKNVRYILLTHGHYDHILGVPALKAHTGAEVLIHKADADCFWDTEKASLRLTIRFRKRRRKRTVCFQTGKKFI